MIKVAITGNIASGKSAVEDILKFNDFKVLDTDEVNHKLQENEDVISKIDSAFNGFDILENGKISRPKLGRIVFNDEKLRKVLESILHPLIKDEINKFFNQNQDEKIVFVSIPLLFEVGFENLFDKVMLVYTDDDIRLKRLMNRNGLSIDAAKCRINSQMPQNEKVSRSDFVIKNNDSIDELNSQVENLLVKLV